MQQRIFKISRTGRVGYDEVDCFVIVAVSSDEARRLALDEAGDEDHLIWVDDTLSTCECVGHAFAETPRVLCRSFNAG
jgi:replicative superfamily II helicase